MKDVSKQMTRSDYEDLITKKLIEISALFNAISSIAISLYSTEFRNEFIYSNRDNLIEELSTLKERKSELSDHVFSIAMSLLDASDIEDNGSKIPV